MASCRFHRFIAANFDAIQNHINGMSIADTGALAGEENPVDAISALPWWIPPAT